VLPTVASSIDIVVHAELQASGHRRVVEIVAPTGEVVGGTIAVTRLFELRGGALQSTGETPVRTGRVMAPMPVLAFGAGGAA
jgi:pilus assembly protein CpaF